MKQKHHGFTLTELMIAVAIVGILASIAVPNYQNSIRKSRRADAQGALVSFANAMERHYTEVNSYCDAGGVGGVNTCNTASADTNINDTGSPSIYPTQSPVDGKDKYYDLTINAVSVNSYTLWATPINAQANDECGTLTLAHTGARNLDPPLTSNDSRADCW
jgi:type IV pilus assembly protein PilE